MSSKKTDTWLGSRRRKRDLGRGLSDNRRGESASLLLGPRLKKRTNNMQIHIGLIKSHLTIPTRDKRRYYWTRFLHCDAKYVHDIQGAEILSIRNFFIRRRFDLCIHVSLSDVEKSAFWRNFLLINHIWIHKKMFMLEKKNIKNYFANQSNNRKRNSICFQFYSNKIKSTHSIYFQI